MTELENFLTIIYYKNALKTYLEMEQHDLKEFNSQCRIHHEHCSYSGFE